jgi:glycerophosphoryl diester phosphodiesterase
MTLNTDKWPYPLWVAHRGAGKLAPENTLAAFRLGARCGYRMFECDVKLSSDGVPFLLHDSSLGRTTNATQQLDTTASEIAGEHPWHTLAQLDAGSWHSRQYAGEPLPSFANIAHFCLANSYFLNIEIKPTPGLERMTGEVVAHNAAKLWNNAATPPLLSSFDPPALEGARAAQAPFAARPAARHAVGRLAANRPQASMRGHRLQAHAVGQRERVASKICRFSLPVLHRQRQSGSAEPHNIRHRGPHHRSGGPVFTSMSWLANHLRARRSSFPAALQAPLGAGTRKCHGSIGGHLAIAAKKPQAQRKSDNGYYEINSCLRIQRERYSIVFYKNPRSHRHQQRHPQGGATKLSK